MRWLGGVIPCLEAACIHLSSLMQGVNWTKMMSHIAKQNQGENWDQALGPACPRCLTVTSLSTSFPLLQRACSTTNFPRGHLSRVDGSGSVPCGLIPVSLLFSSIRQRLLFWVFALIATPAEAAPCHLKGPTERGHLKKKHFLSGECNPTTGENTCKTPKKERTVRYSYPSC